jgi:hypothetical protein|tara:strand:+ start:2552 stop:2842 length:291 start_codon:yes stop_codon:yes gene_type:complete
MENQDSWSNALGYGFWCGRNCAESKMAAGIPPLGSSRARKGKDAASDAVLAQAALEQTRNSAKEDSWSPMAVAGVVGASLLGIAIMVVIIVRAKKK